jgi:hypothetical protein
MSPRARLASAGGRDRLNFGQAPAIRPVVKTRRFMNAGGSDGLMEKIGIGHNIEGIVIEVQVRLFNSLARFAPAGARQRTLALPAGSSIGDILEVLGIPPREVHLAFRNGRDVTPRLRGGLNTEHAVEAGDVVALSGPVPYSWGYGAPVV